MYSAAVGTLLFAIISAHQALGQIQCGDNSTFCPSGSTCCPLDARTNTHYGCCPIPDAVCCEDKLHCCPSGMTCDTAHAQCTNGQLRIPMHKKLQEKSSSEESHETESSSNRLVHRPAKTKSPSNKVGIPLEASRRECANGDTCSGESTCCYDRNDEAFCCPVVNGKCCLNGKKCCAHGFRCSSYGDECIRERNGITMTMNMLETELSQHAQTKSEEAAWVSCPDRTRCPPQNTCCPTNFNPKLRTYRCCPLTNAACCAAHCCPNGYKCTHNGQCKTASELSIFDSLFN